jgi:hypothetical protein
MSVDGAWKITLNTPMGAQERHLTLASDGATLTGSMSGPQGENAIEDGSVDGNAVSWSVMAPQIGAKVAFSGTVDGDTMSGQAVLGAFGSAPFSGVRA